MMADSIMNFISSPPRIFLNIELVEKVYWTNVQYHHHRHV